MFTLKYIIRYTMCVQIYRTHVYNRAQLTYYGTDHLRHRKMSYLVYIG